MIKTMKTDNLIESLLKLIHKCLVCLGDISRYLSEYDGCIQTAEKYYTMAVLLDHEVGMCFEMKSKTLLR